MGFDHPVARERKNKGENGTAKSLPTRRLAGRRLVGACPYEGGPAVWGIEGVSEYARIAVRGGVVLGPFWPGRESLNVSGGGLAERESLGLSLTGGAASGRGAFAGVPPPKSRCR